MGEPGKRGVFGRLPPQRRYQRDVVMLRRGAAENVHRGNDALHQACRVSSGEPLRQGLQPLLSEFLAAFIHRLRPPVGVEHQPVTAAQHGLPLAVRRPGREPQAGAAGAQPLRLAQGARTDSAGLWPADE